MRAPETYCAHCRTNLLWLCSECGQSWRWWSCSNDLEQVLWHWCWAEWNRAPETYCGHCRTNLSLLPDPALFALPISSTALNCCSTFCRKLLYGAGTIVVINSKKGHLSSGKSQVHSWLSIRAVLGCQGNMALLLSPPNYCSFSSTSAVMMEGTTNVVLQVLWWCRVLQM